MKCIVKQPVAVFRDGKQVLPRVGETFEFTNKEVFEIGKLNPAALVEVAEEALVAVEKLEMPPAKNVKRDN